MQVTPEMTVGIQVPIPSRPLSPWIQSKTVSRTHVCGCFRVGQCEPGPRLGGFGGQLRMAGIRCHCFLLPVLILGFLLFVENDIAFLFFHLKY